MEALKQAEKFVPENHRAKYDLAKGLYLDPKKQMEQLVPEEYKGAYEKAN